MRPHYLAPFFAPRSLAIVGSLSNPEALSGSVYANLTSNHYQGQLFAINNENHPNTLLENQHDLDSLPVVPELLMLECASEEIESYLLRCATLGIKNIVLMNDITQVDQIHYETLKDKWKQLCQAHDIRIMGPNCSGVLRPSIGMSPPPMKPGSLGMVSQSNALSSGVLDWANGNGLGFSAVVSLGESIDVDFAEAIDFLVSDYQTQSILVFVEQVSQPRLFMSALREAARIKPTIVLKADKHALIRTGDQLSDQTSEQRDNIFNAALQRAGVVRVRTMTQLFAAARACSLRYRKSGPRLAILSNGEGPAALATDRALDHHIPLASLGETTIQALADLSHQSPSNPLDLGPHAKAKAYEDSAQVLVNAAEVDSLLVILCPQHGSQALETAQAVVNIAQNCSKPIMACWMGDQSVVPSRQLFSAHRVPNFRTPESAVDAIRYINQYLHNQQLLFQTTGPTTSDSPPLLERARELVTQQLALGNKELSSLETEKLLATFKLTYHANIPIPPNTGKHARFLINLGIVRDSMLGPSLYLSPGGLAAHLPQANTYALPPLNHFLAEEFIQRSLLSRLTYGQTGMAISQHPVLIQFILRLSEMCCELPSIETVHLQLWHQDEQTIEILHADIALNDHPSLAHDYRHLAIHPYPSDLVKTLSLKNGDHIAIRPIRPEDAEMEQDFVRNLSEDSRYYRFLDALKELPKSMLVRFTHLDYSREMALIATLSREDKELQIGVARYTTNPDGQSCEFALVIADQWQGQGLGKTLMNELIQCAKKRHLTTMVGEVLGKNQAMLHLMHHLGFVSEIDPEEPSLRTVTLDLNHYPNC